VQEFGNGRRDKHCRRHTVWLQLSNPIVFELSPALEALSPKTGTGAGANSTYGQNAGNGGNRKLADMNGDGLPELG